MIGATIQSCGCDFPPLLVVYYGDHKISKDSRLAILCSDIFFGPTLVFLIVSERDFIRKINGLVLLPHVGRSIYKPITVAAPLSLRGRNERVPSGSGDDQDALTRMAARPERKPRNKMGASRRRRRSYRNAKNTKKIDKKRGDSRDS